MNKKIILLIVLLLVIAGIYFWMKKPATAPTANPEASADTIEAISTDANSLDAGSDEGDFEEIDSDIQSL